jgi:hypothetical protein
MSCNFFIDNQKIPICDYFGFCDDQIQQPARISFSNEKVWDARIDNTVHESLSFVPVDNNLKMIFTGPKCDVLLFSEKYNGIYFIELKCRRPDGYIPYAVEQLQNTITVFQKNHCLNSDSKRYAYICNRKKPQFAYAQAQRMQKFKQETSFTLMIQYNVKIKK